MSLNEGCLPHYCPPEKSFQTAWTRVLWVDWVLVLNDWLSGVMSLSLLVTYQNWLTGKLDAMKQHLCHPSSQKKRLRLHCGGMPSRMLEIVVVTCILTGDSSTLGEFLSDLIASLKTYCCMSPVDVLQYQLRWTAWSNPQVLSKVHHLLVSTVPSSNPAQTKQYQCQSPELFRQCLQPPTHP